MLISLGIDGILSLGGFGTRPYKRNVGGVSRGRFQTCPISVVNIDNGRNTVEKNKPFANRYTAQVKLYIKNNNIQTIQHSLFLFLGVVVCVYAVFVFYWMSNYRYSGFHAFPGTDGILEIIDIKPESPADRKGLLPGDKILKINDNELSTPASWYLSCFLQRINDKNLITYQRGDNVFTTDLVTESPLFPWSTLWGVLICFFLFTLCLTVYLKKPYSAFVQVSYLAGCCVSIGLISLFNFFSIINPMGVISGIAVLALPICLHFTLIFPERKKIIDQYPYLLMVIYFPAVIWMSHTGVFVLRLFVSHFSGNIFPKPELYSNMVLFQAKSFSTLFILYFVASFGSITHSFLNTNSPEKKKQVKWLAVGSAIATILIVFGSKNFFTDSLFLKQYITGGETLPPLLIIACVTMVFSAGLAILKYRLMDIDIIIHHSFAYATVSFASIILYFFLFDSLTRLFQNYPEKVTLTVYAISAFIVAFIFRPLSNLIMKKLDNFFFREKYEFPIAIEKLMSHLNAKRHFQTIFEAVFSVVENILHISSGTLYILNQESETFEHAVSIPDTISKNGKPTFHLSHPLVVYLKRYGKGLTRYEVLSNRKFENRDHFMALFEKTGMDILLPLIFEERLLGIIGFGAKRSGDIYSSYDVRMLTIITHQTAVAMENARAYEQINHLNSNLEEKVRRIEQQHHEIFALQKQMLNENVYLREELRQQCNFEEIIGSSPQMKQVLDMVEKVAPTPSTVLIRGESGTGKELIARAIHSNSLRQERPFVKVNCAAIPANLLESELFGHEKGAFTGAVNQKQGKFEMAFGGTIFLDEIGELATDLQVKLLRVLQEKEFERVGGTKVLKADVRVIAATNRDIEKAIRERVFREDLFYRLNVISVKMPPLRERKEDIRELTIHFLMKFGRQLNKSIRNIDPDAIKMLKSYDWPGNVRELGNIIERALVLGEGDTLSAADLPQSLVLKIEDKKKPSTKSFTHEIKDIEIQLISDAIEKANGNKSEAARILGMKRTTLISKLNRINA